MINSKSFLTSAILSSFTLLSGAIIFPGKLHAAACPAASSLTSVATGGDATSFLEVTGGDCAGTPTTYGVKVYKMGFCSSDPFSGVTAGNAPVYTSCSWTFSNSSGEYQSFSEGSSVALSADSSSMPETGTYGYSVIELEPTFTIKASYGPFNDGSSTTYYSTSTYGTTSTDSGLHGEFEAPINTFMGNSDKGLGEDGDNLCNAYDEVENSAGTITGYLLNSAGTLIADNAAITSCSSAAGGEGVNRLIGVQALTTSVEITSSTTGITATFDVSDNGTTVTYDGGTGIGLDAGPFSVGFTITE